MTISHRRHALGVDRSTTTSRANEGVLEGTLSIPRLHGQPLTFVFTNRSSVHRGHAHEPRGAQLGEDSEHAQVCSWVRQDDRPVGRVHGGCKTRRTGDGERWGMETPAMNDLLPWTPRCYVTYGLLHHKRPLSLQFWRQPFEPSDRIGLGIGAKTIRMPPGWIEQPTSP